MLADYSAECKDWTLVAGEHWKQGRFQRAQELLGKGIQCEGGSQHENGCGTSLTFPQSSLLDQDDSRTLLRS